uniref:Rab-GAP TBC domain-containing protein n=1 Tax=Macrostomum lignano TaxID=282301 RepID=A0A1I8FBS9_9PLAT
TPRGKRIADLIEKHEVPPAFSVAWVITWFGHVLDDLDAILRLYDFFLASHPLMRCTLVLLWFCTSRDRLLSLPPEDIDFAVLHSCLANIPNSGAIQLETVISEACRLFIPATAGHCPVPVLPGGQAEASRRDLGLLMVKAQVSLPHLLRSRGALLILLAVLVALLAVLSHKSFSQRPIQQLEAVATLSLLISLSDGTVSVHNSGTRLKALSVLDRTRGAPLPCLRLVTRPRQIPGGGERQNNPTLACAFTSSSGCCFYPLGLLGLGSSRACLPAGTRPASIARPSEPSAGLANSALTSLHLLKTDYFRIRRPRARVMARQLSATLWRLCSKDSKTMFVNERRAAGDAVRKANDGPVDGQCGPRSSAAAQSLAQRQPAPRRVVRCLCQVSLLPATPRPLSAQIKVLIQRRDFELALRLHERSASRISDRCADELRDIDVLAPSSPLTLEKLRQLVDTSLLKCYLESNPALGAFPCFAPPTIVTLREAEACLKTEADISNIEDSVLVPAGTGGVPYQDLIFRYSRWINRARTPRRACESFTESQADGDNALPRIEVANFLRVLALLNCLTDYLEHCVLHCKPPDTSESLHTDWLTRALAGRYPNNDMLEERALLLSRLGQYELAFTILAQARSYGQLIKALLAPLPAEAYKLHAPRAPAPMTQRALQLLKRRPGQIPPSCRCCAATRWPDLSDYLLTSLQRLEAEKRLLQSRRGLYHAERLQTAAAFARFRSGRVASEEGTRCSVCQNRIGASAFCQVPVAPGSPLRLHGGVMRARLSGRQSGAEGGRCRHCSCLIKVGRLAVVQSPRIASRAASSAAASTDKWSNLKGRISHSARLLRSPENRAQLLRRSTRTRVSTETGFFLLGRRSAGCSSVPQDVHLGTNESLPDTAKVLSGFCDAVLARCMRTTRWLGLVKLQMTLSEHSSVPIVLADFLSRVYENFGHSTGLVWAFVGDGDNNDALLDDAAAQKLCRHIPVRPVPSMPVFPVPFNTCFALCLQKPVAALVLQYLFHISSIPVSNVFPCLQYLFLWTSITVPLVPFQYLFPCAFNTFSPVPSIPVPLVPSIPFPLCLHIPVRCAFNTVRAVPSTIPVPPPGVPSIPVPLCLQYLVPLCLQYLSRWSFNTCSRLTTVTKTSSSPQIRIRFRPRTIDPNGPRQVGAGRRARELSRQYATSWCSPEIPPRRFAALTSFVRTHSSVWRERAEKERRLKDFKGF